MTKKVEITEKRAELEREVMDTVILQQLQELKELVASDRANVTTITENHKIYEQRKRPFLLSTIWAALTGSLSTLCFLFMVFNWDSITWYIGHIIH